jgi:uncharacterized protein YbjT (DUF2867 family)
VLPAQHRDDAVGLTQLVGAQHDGFITVKGHLPIIGAATTMEVRRQANEQGTRYMTTLVTGGTGTLGRELVPLLRSRDVGTAVLSRREHPEFRTADLSTGAGLASALDGVDTVVHLAAGKVQERETRTLVSAAAEAGVGHVVLISIAGIDEIPFSYYRAKLAAERVVLDGSVPATVLRTTQFHSFAVAPFLAQRHWPVLLSPLLNVQPIDVRIVAAQLADLAAGSPQGRVPDLGGPEVLTGEDIARTVASRFEWRKRIVRVALPGRTWAAFAAGHHLVPNSRSGGRTLREYVAAL